MTKNGVDSIRMQEYNNLSLTYMSRGKKKKEKNSPNTNTLFRQRHG